MLDEVRIKLYVKFLSKHFTQFLLCPSELKNMSYLDLSKFVVKRIGSSHHCPSNIKRAYTTSRIDFKGRNFPWKKLSLEETFPGRNFPWKKVSLKETFPERNFPWKKLSLKETFPGRNFPKLENMGNIWN